jgi:hypothetical protein
VAAEEGHVALEIMHIYQGAANDLPRAHICMCLSGHVCTYWAWLIDGVNLNNNIFYFCFVGEYSPDFRCGDANF